MNNAQIFIYIQLKFAIATAYLELRLYFEPTPKKTDNGLIG